MELESSKFSGPVNTGPVVMKKNIHGPRPYHGTVFCGFGWGFDFAVNASSLTGTGCETPGPFSIILLV